MAKITYTNKETLNSQPSIAAKNKVTSDDMNEIKQVVNDNDDTLISQGTTINNIKGTLLWTNPNPTSSFSGQALSNVDLTDYDMIEIFFNDAADKTMIHSTGRLPKQNGNLISQFNGSLWDRNYTINNNNITFGNGHKYATYGNNTTTDNNNAIIPIYIVGYKTGLF